MSRASVSVSTRIAAAVVAAVVHLEEDTLAVRVLTMFYEFSSVHQDQAIVEAGENTAVEENARWEV
jgi:hypothetical protein